MLDVGAPELIIILVIAIVVFGPGRLAGLGKSLGDSIKGFRQAMHEDMPATPVTTAVVPAPVVAPTAIVTTTALPVVVETPGTDDLTPQVAIPAAMPAEIAAIHQTSTDAQM